MSTQESITILVQPSPVMTTGAAYDLCQSLGWKNGLHHTPKEASKFYVAIALFTAIAMGLNFID